MANTSAWRIIKEEKAMDKLLSEQLELAIGKLGGEDFVRRVLSGELLIINTKKTISFGDRVRALEKDGWRLLEHAPRTLSSCRLELVPFYGERRHQGIESACISGEEMLRQARFELKIRYGEEDANFILTHKKELPGDFKNFRLVFPGTVWRDEKGCRRVTVLSFVKWHWHLCWDYLSNRCISANRLVRAI